MPEASLERTEHGLTPAGEGWFVVSARDARWQDGGPFGLWTSFEGETARFGELGINITLLHRLGLLPLRALDRARARRRR